MHFSSTDLPLPEPPITTTDSPTATSRSMPRSTCLAPKALVTPRSDIFGATIDQRFSVVLSAAKDLIAAGHSRSFAALRMTGEDVTDSRAFITGRRRLR